MRARLAPFLWHPLALSASIVAFGTLAARDLPLGLAVFTPLAAVVAAIIALEALDPERADWRPRPADWRVDAAFMALVQLFVPRALTACALLWVAGWAHAHAASRWWPHDWPLFGQLAAVVLLVDFMRYWLHRACHRFEFLWRLHEVHHAPRVLYWMNVGRFHPLEKALQWCLDTGPFLLLGVAPEVLAGYFVIYAVNGFFQHSNIRLRLGRLNYVIAGAELHRWHHASDPRRAPCNFSNTTAVWDLVFGTWHLPAGETVREVGVQDHGYPVSIASQLLHPFRGAQVGAVGSAWRDRLAGLLLDLHLWCVRLFESRRIVAALRNPMRIQRVLLARILYENRGTAFGRAHGFGGIASHAEYAQRVPVAEFESLRPYIDAAIAGDERSLTAETALHYVRTSGTTGRAKDIPLTPAHLKALRRCHETAVAMQHRICPQAFSGGILAIVSPATEGRLPNGAGFGSASGIVAGNTPAIVRSKFVLPPEVLAIEDYELKYLLILRLALARRDLSYIATANPSTLLMLSQRYREHAAALIGDLRNGGFFCRERVPEAAWRAVEPRLAPNRERARELENLPPAKARLADLWPGLRLVATWTCASAGVAVPALRRELSPHTRILDLGYIASEFRGTIVLGRRAGSGMPTVHAHFFEFVERGRWDSGHPEYLTLDGLRKGVEYYIVVTTPSGLYRYFINDLVRVRGFLGRMPLLAFAQKGKGVTNVTGEKLCESQVLDAVRAVAAQRGLATRFVMMLADEAVRSYRLYVEPVGRVPVAAAELAADVEAKLDDANVEYRCKRRSGRLAPLGVAWLQDGTAEAYKRHCVASGQREGQFKVVALAYRSAFDFDLDARVVAGAP